MDIHQHNRNLIGKFRAALYDIELDKLRAQLHDVFAPDASIHLAFPFEDLDGPDDLFETAYNPLIYAVPDLERRDFIVVAGESNGANLVGCGGHYIGVFEDYWLDIPPTQHAVFMRYHEFFRIEGDRVVEMQAVWDIPQVMIQADAWPMSPALGMAWQVPAPAPQNGLKHGPHDTETSATAYQVVFDMLTSILRSSEGVDAMQLDRYWHPKMNWYGPAGIGSMRRITGFRNWHQIPFLKAMPDRAADLNTCYMFADDDIVAFTAWPGAQLTLTQDGWLGIPPLNKPLTMRSLDFWRVENGMIRENWVLVDLLDMYNQMGVDVFSRMCEVTVARQPRGSFTI